MRRQQGHTLTELLVVVLILGLVFSLVVRASPTLDGSTRKLQERAYVVGELRLAVESLLADLGGAERLEVPQAPRRLIIHREPLLAGSLGIQGDDTGVAYVLDGQDLLRQDLDLGLTVVVAQGLTEFEIRELDPALGLTGLPAGDAGASVEPLAPVRITLAAGTGLAERRLELRWGG